MAQIVKKIVISSHWVWADLIRIFAIIGVVTIHAFVLPPLTSANVNFETSFNWLYFIALKTCVPLFLMLSGALLLEKAETDQVFYLKRVKRVIVPWLFWSVVFLFAKYQSDLTTLPHVLRTLTKIASAEFSFLPALFCLYLLMPFFKIIMKYKKPWYQWQLIGFWFLGISLLPYIRDTMAFPAIVDNGLVRQTVNYSGFILLGYVLKIWLQKSPKVSTLFFPSFFVFITAVLGTFNLQLHQPSTPPLFLAYIAPLIVVSSASAFVMLYLMGQKLQNHPSQKVIQEFSAASFGVFFVHPLIVTWLTPTVLTSNLTWKNLLLSILSLSVSFLVILILRSFPSLKKLVS